LVGGASMGVSFLYLGDLSKSREDDKRTTTIHEGARVEGLFQLGSECRGKKRVV